MSRRNACLVFIYVFFFDDITADVLFFLNFRVLMMSEHVRCSFILLFCNDDGREGWSPCLRWLMSCLDSYFWWARDEWMSDSLHPPFGLWANSTSHIRILNDFFLLYSDNTEGRRHLYKSSKWCLWADTLWWDGKQRREFSPLTKIRKRKGKETRHEELVCEDVMIRRKKENERKSRIINWIYRLFQLDFLLYSPLEFLWHQHHPLSYASRVLP